MTLPEGIDLSDGRTALEDLMTDSCEITRDENGAADDAINPTTGRLTRPPGNTSTIYSADTTGDGGRSLDGRCKIKALGPADTIVVEGQRTYLERAAVASLPWDAPEIKHNDRLRVVTSLNDAQLVDKIFKVVDASYGSMTFKRQLLMQEVNY